MKLFNTISEILNAIKNKPILDLVFLIVFVVLLFLPVININYGKVSVDEKRKLAKWKPLFTKKHTINYNFGRDFDNWFNDRFNLRKFYIYGYKILEYTFAMEIVDTPEAVLNKKTHWIFSKENMDNNKYTKSRKVEILAENLNNFGDYWASQGIKFYVFLIPYQEDIYYEKFLPYPSNLAYVSHNNAAMKIKSLLRYPLVYPYDALKSASKTEQVYFKTDYHWTDIGASIGNRVLLSELKKDYPDIIIDDISNYNVTYTNKIKCDFYITKEDSGESLDAYFPFLKDSETFLDTEYAYYENKDSKNLETEIIDIPYKKGKIYSYPKGADLRVVIIGNSMNENLLLFLPYAFKNLKYIRINTVRNIPDNEKYKLIKHYKDEILDYKPDIIILSMSRSVLVHSAEFLSEE